MKFAMDKHLSPLGKYKKKIQKGNAKIIMNISSIDETKVKGTFVIKTSHVCVCALRKRNKFHSHCYDLDTKLQSHFYTGI